MMRSHVVVVGKEVNYRLINLDVEIAIPRKDLLPSAKMSATKRIRSMSPFDSTTKPEVSHALSRFRHEGQSSSISKFG